MTDSGTSADVLTAARNGSREALGRLYAEHADAVYTLAYRITGSREEAEDVLQDVFVGLPRALGSYEELSRFEAWLGRVTTRTALMRIRSVRRKREDPLDGVPEAAGTVGARVHPVDAIAMRQAVARLPEPCRVVFVLREVEGYSHAEVGELLGITAAASAMRLSRAWTILRKEARR